MHDFLAGLIFVPLIIFMVVIAPLWLILHYRSKRLLGQGLSEQETMDLASLARTAEKMSQRIITLEKILDHETPNWRGNHD
ncbi:envelope stress response membrane protein PspB [Algibacillus agarilyticus]|uniref:envelope stress response membrane protein PspB n=1 Tax=Algibacillus agarilyticus TaxID=2234133 RepID=UPI000DCF88D1|nr:envelope stress response membrane protein PspB [Algibacillus agarilyticus]